MVKHFSVQLPWLETLNLHKNHIKGIPDQVSKNSRGCFCPTLKSYVVSSPSCTVSQIAFEMRAFSSLETLDLADNPITYHYNLFALEKLQKLRKVKAYSKSLVRIR